MDETFLGSTPRAEAVVGIDEALAWALFESSPDGVLITRRDGTIALVSRRIEEMFGYAREDLLGRAVEVLLPTDDRGKHAAHRLRYVAAPIPRAMGQGLELWGRRADGAEFPVEVSLSPCQSAAGDMFIATVRDVSTRRASEQQLHSVLRLLDGLTQAVYMLDPDTLQLTYVNHGAVTQTRYSADELLTMTPMHISPTMTEFELRNIIGPLLAGAQTSTVVTSVIRSRDGVDHPVECHIDVPPALRGDNPQVVVVAIDISERMKQEQRVREAQELIALASDRERIARDLHDNVVQDLFGAALGLQSIAMRVEDAGVRSRTLEIVDHVDNVIREIRTTIFAMTAHRDGTGTLQDRLLATIDEASRALRFRPSFRSHGPVDTATSEHIAEQLLPTLREALANVTRHAHATNADIDLSFDGGMLTLTVADNGIGLPEQQASPGHGLRNMGDRAADLGGTMTLANNGDQGTILTWRVPSPTHPLPA